MPGRTPETTETAGPQVDTAHTAIADMEPSDRPRERLVALGAERMRDAELLAVVIGSGTPALSSVELARLVLKTTGGLPGLARCTPAQLQALPGVGQAVALRIVASLALGSRAAARGRAAPKVPEG